MDRAVVDIECYRNLFSITAEDYDSDSVVVFEITERRNDIDDIYAFLMSMKYFIGFNNVHYDSPICRYIVLEYQRLRTLEYLDITVDLKKFSDSIINASDMDFRKFNNYKYNLPWINIDVFMFWSKMLRLSKKMSLKMLQVNINWPRVQELPIHHADDIKLEQIPEFLDYNYNDVASTKAVAKKLSEEINLRMGAKKRYGFDCMSWDGVKLGLNIIVERYSRRTGIPADEVRKMRTFRDEINIGELILPLVNFTPGDTSYVQAIEEKKIVYRFKSFYGLHQYLNNLKVLDTKTINCQLFIQGNRYDIKSGGLHTYHNGSVIIPADDEYYEDIDVEGYYPSLATEWKFIPEHLGVECAEELGDMKGERSVLKATGLGKSIEANLIKLSLNGGFYGNTNNEYTPMFDKKCMLSITINGQLMLLMLCERLMEIGVKIDMCNTDGVTILYKKHLKDQVKQIIKDWEQLSRMKMESVIYSKVVRMNINNYIAFHADGSKPKEKGMFMTNPGIDLSHDHLVIAKALMAYFKDGTSIEDFIRAHDNIYDFCASQKVDKSYTVYWNNQPQQRLNRYYVSETGPYLYKTKAGKQAHMLAGWSVQLFNNYEEREMKDYRINYSYYIAETKKLINELQSEQLNLF